MQKTVVVVPCYNEANRLEAGRFIDFSMRHDWVKILLVNDGSTDDTLDCLNTIRKDSRRRIEVLDLQENVGKAEAVRQGVLAALGQQPHSIGYWDADLATPLEEVPRFRQVLARRTQVRLVMGSRMPLLGRTIDRHPLRALCGRTFATAASVALGTGIFDTQCGAKLFRCDHVTRSILVQPFISRWIFDVEILARLIHHDGHTGSGALRSAVYELPLEHWQDVPGSKLKATDFVRAVWELARIYHRYRWNGRKFQPAVWDADEAPQLGSWVSEQEALPDRRQAA